jgi:tetraacyldisaccharide 4'-kinase
MAGRPARVLGAIVGAHTRRRVVVAQPASGARVVVVGGPAVGGAGRTAVVQALAQRAVAAGRRVVIVGHGYRGTARGVVEVLGADARLYGDEAAALAQALPSVPVWIGPRAAVVARVCGQADLVLVDGGLLDPQVAPTGVIAVLDATAPRGVLPAGPNRVAPDALEVDLRWLHRVDEAGARPWQGAGVESRVVASHVVFEGRRLPPAWLVERAVVPICGVARPGSFLALLDRLGAQRLPGLVRADHHRFRAHEARALSPDACWITTAKDAPRLPAEWPVAVLHIDVALTVHAPAALDTLLGFAL